MKKYVSLLSALVLVLLLSACGGTRSVETPDPTASPAPTQAPAVTPVPTEEPPVLSGTPLSTEYWSGVIPAGLLPNENYNYEYSDYSFHEFVKRDAEDLPVLTFDVSVSEEDSMSYRKTLVDLGCSLKDQAAGGMETVSIGGLEFLPFSGRYWGEDAMTYLARPAGSGMTVTLRVYGSELQGQDAEALLNSLVFSVPDRGLAESPFPQEGEPYLAVTAPVELNGVTLTPQQLPADDCFLAMNVFSNSVAIVGGRLYSLSQDLLRIYAISEEDTLILESELELDSSYDRMSVTDDGRVFLTGYLCRAQELQNGAPVRTWDTKQEFAVSPDGSFGIGYFTQVSDLTKITLREDGTAAEEAFLLSGGPELGMVTAAFVTENYVGLNAYAKEDGSLYLFLYDHHGGFLRQLRDETGGAFGSITGLAELDGRLCALDGNLRKLIVWSKDGSCLGSADAGVLFGTDCPWMNGLCAADGRLYVSMSDKRPDGSWDEILFFRVELS